MKKSNFLILLQLDNTVHSLQSRVGRERTMSQSLLLSSYLIPDTRYLILKIE